MVVRSTRFSHTEVQSHVDIIVSGTLDSIDLSHQNLNGIIVVYKNDNDDATVTFKDGFACVTNSRGYSAILGSTPDHDRMQKLQTDEGLRSKEHSAVWRVGLSVADSASVPSNNGGVPYGHVRWNDGVAFAAFGAPPEPGKYIMKGELIPVVSPCAVIATQCVMGDKSKGPRGGKAKGKHMQDKGKDTGKGRDTGKDDSGKADSGKGTGKGKPFGKDYGKDHGKDGKDSGKGPGKGPGKDYGKDYGKDRKDSGKGPGKDYGKAYGGDYRNDYGKD